MPVIGAIEAHPYIEFLFRLRDGVTPARVRAVFGTIPDLRQIGPFRWLWFDEPPADVAPATPAVFEPSVLGMIALDDRRLDVRLRSGPCTARVQAVLAPVLEALADPPLQLGIARRPPPTTDVPAPWRPAAAAPVRVEPVVVHGGLVHGGAEDATGPLPGGDDRMVACLAIARPETSPECRGRTRKGASHWLWSIPRTVTPRR